MFTEEGSCLLSIGRVSQWIGRKIPSIREYHKKGVIPAPHHLDKRGWRFYTVDQAMLLKEAFRRYDDPDNQEIKTLTDVATFLKTRWDIKTKTISVQADQRSESLVAQQKNGSNELPPTLLPSQKTREAIIVRKVDNNSQFIPKKSRKVGEWNESSFIYDMRNRCSGDVLKVAIKIIEWIKSRRLGPAYGKGGVNGSFFPKINSKIKKFRPFTVYSEGRMEIWFAFIKQLQPFDNEQKLLELLFRLNQISGVNLEKESINCYPGIRLSVFIEDHAINQFFAIFDWVIQEIKSAQFV
jgi:hypothetical protein